MGRKKENTKTYDLYENMKLEKMQNTNTARANK